ncbi:MAG: hypothetical protein E2P04_01385 [Acidobacteria bacterium]|nr:MAG: hypothetical protein E2P04_01385 [Acidobacteriota bacterium]
MRRSLLAWYARCLVRRPGWILAAGIALTIGSLLLVSLRLELRTSRENLSGSFHQAEAEFDAFVKEFGSPHYLVVVVEPADPSDPVQPEDYRAFVDGLAALLEAETEYFDEVFYRVDLQHFLDLGLYYADRDTLRQAEEALVGPDALLPDGSRLLGLADANRLLARKMRRGLAQGEPSAGSDASLGGVLSVLRWQVRFLADPEAAVAQLQDDDPFLRMGTSGPALSRDGYLTSSDGRHYFLLAQPARNTSSLDFIRPLVATARDKIAQVAAQHPGLQAGVTGTPALIQEEMAAIRRDSLVTTVLAGVGVMLLCFLAFHRVRLAPLVLLSLAMGVSWSAGAITLAIGYLSLITSSFAVILIGLGVDYGVHLVSQYEIELAEGRTVPEALQNSIGKTGPGLLTGAGTTAVAFFTIMLMEFRGFAQLGFVAGIGVLLCLLAMLTVLPALLALDGARRLGKPRRHRLERGRRLSLAILRYPRAVVAVGLVVTLVLALKAREVRYNENLEDLLPAGAESLRLQDSLRDSSSLSPDFSVILADDLEELARLQQAAPNAASIGRRESLLDYLPADAGERQAVLARLRPALDRVRLPLPAAAELAPADLDASLAELEEVLIEVEDLAFSSGRAALLGESGQGLDLIQQARHAIASAQPAHQQAWKRGNAGLLQWGREWMERLRRMAAEPPPTLEDLPQALQSRLVGRSGRYLLYLYPQEDLTLPDALRTFVADCRKVSDAVTGPPVLLYEHSGQIRGGFNQALILGAVLALGILLLDFRRPGYALLAALPTAVGLIWMLGWMGWAGLEFNLANLIAVPLILGVGIDNGAHMMHRFVQEGHQGMTVVLHHTGRAILISSLTTMIGFGSLALASHRGMASMGLILFFGVASCLITSTLLLPCLLRLLAARRGAPS